MYAYARMRCITRGRVRPADVPPHDLARASALSCTGVPRPCSTSRDAQRARGEEADLSRRSCGCRSSCARASSRSSPAEWSGTAGALRAAMFRQERLGQMELRFHLRSFQTFLCAPKFGARPIYSLRFRNADLFFDPLAAPSRLSNFACEIGHNAVRTRCDHIGVRSVPCARGMRPACAIRVENGW
ncbi:hypothetical protein D3C86_1548370 [compost metagenome]